MPKIFKRITRESLEKALHRTSGFSGGSCYDLSQDLAGSVKGLPEDIATNPDYLDGFGR